MRRRGFFALAAVLACGARAQQAPGERAGLQALRLAALAERIAKLFYQVAQGVLVDRSRRALAEASREFERVLAAVTAEARSAEAREACLLLRLLWEEYRTWAARPATRDNARKLAERADEVAWVAAKCARLLDAVRAAALDAAIAAGLAQRLARLHFMRRWEPRDAALERRATATAQELRRVLATLAQHAASQAAVVAELQVAENQHVFLEQALRDIAHGRGAAAFEVLAKAADHMMEALQRAARLLGPAAA